MPSQKHPLLDDLPDDPDDVRELRLHLRLVRLQDCLLGLLAEFNEEAAAHGGMRASAIEVGMDARGHGDVQFFDGAFPISGMSL